VFDIAFAPTDVRGEQPYDFRAQALAAEPDSEPAFDFPDQAASPVQDAELPLPWADQSPPEQIETHAAAPAVQPGEMQPPTITPDTTPAATVEPPDADAQALLRALLAEIGSGLEQRLQAELALTEQRLRAAVREELDTRLRELLAGAPTHRLISRRWPALPNWTRTTTPRPWNSAGTERLETRGYFRP